MSLVGDWRCGLSLAECNNYMLNHQIHCDVTFRVGEEGKPVRAHKYVLASRSPVFDVMLFGDLAELDDIKVPDIEPSTFEALLRFMYCDEASYTEDTVIALLYAAEKYGVNDLVTNITSYLDQNITEETVVAILESAQIFDLDDLVKKCKDYIEVNPIPLLQSSSALEITRETLDFVLSLDSLEMDELEIYQFLLIWAENQCDAAGMTVTDENIRMMMGDLIYHIRFHFVKIGTFIKDVCNRRILDTKEKLSLQQVIVGNADKRDTKFKSKERKRKTFCVYRAKGFRERTWLSYTKVNRIDFTVNKHVRIHGYVMWGSKSVPYSYKARGKLYENFKEVSTVDQIIVKREENMFTIHLPEPVLLSPGARYTASVKLNGPIGGGGQIYKSSVTRHGVQFDFYTHDGENNATTVSEGQFPGFVCSF